MNRPVVHIGYHKTATTWFQKVYYPAVGNFAFVPRDRVKRAFLSDTPFAFDADAARETLALDADRPPIVCEEELSGYLHNGGLGGYLSAEMARRIKAVFPDARIVIYIRSQPQIIAACYQQYIRGGGTHGVARYLFAKSYLHGASADAYKVPRFSFAHFEYDRLIAHYDALFGKENVLVTLYEAFRARPDEVLRDHALALGLDVDAPVSAGQRENRSYGAAIVTLARVLNRFTYRTVGDKRTLVHIPYWYTARRKILESLNATGLFGAPPSPERLLGRDVVRWIENRYAQSNRRLAELRDLPLSEFGYPMAETSGVAEPGRRPGMAWLNQ